MTDLEPGWEFFCEHANEAPNICPCPPTCGCHQYTCKGKPTVGETRLDSPGPDVEPDFVPDLIQLLTRFARKMQLAQRRADLDFIRHRIDLARYNSTEALHLGRTLRRLEVEPLVAIKDRRA